MTHQHQHDATTAHYENHSSGDHASLELQITNYLMGSACPHVEHHVSATSDVHHVSLNRVSGILDVGYDPAQVTPDTIIEAVKHCGFICQEDGPIHKAGRVGAAHAKHEAHAVHDEHADHDAHAGHGADMACAGYLAHPPGSHVRISTKTGIIRENR
jgi:cation transport ATPase